VELEHGLQFPDANVTNNHPILTGKIVLAHLKEMLDYYIRLNVAELEGDLLKAYKKGDAEKLSRIYNKMIIARAALSEWEFTEGGV
jgi:restriction endonuclease Mrr